MAFVHWSKLAVLSIFVNNFIPEATRRYSAICGHLSNAVFNKALQVEQVLRAGVAMSKGPEKFYLTLIIVGTMISLSPLFVLNYNKFDTDVVNPPTVFPGTFLVVLIPAADLMLDFLSHSLLYFYPNQRASKRHSETSVVIRLTDTERFLFIMGVAMQSAAYFVPTSADISTISIVNSCSNNCSVLLTLGPIGIFLQRCTTTFTHFKTSTLIIALDVSLISYTISYYFQYGGGTQNVLATIGRIFASMSGLLYISLMLLCAKNYITKNLTLWGIYFWMLVEDGNLAGAKEEDIDNELYTNYIPALHMLSVIIVGIANITVEFNSTNSNRAALMIRNYVTLAAQLMVLVIELRIRKNEIARGLVS